MYSILEQHTDGAWWYHRGLTFKTKEEAEEGFKKYFWWDLQRVHKIIEHTVEFPDDIDRCTTDFKHFHFAGGYEFTLE